MKIGRIIFAILWLFALSIAFGAWYTVRQDERAVLTRWGAIVADNIQPGLHWKTPWTESAHAINIATHKTVYEDMEAYSSDQQPAHFRISVNWHVPSDRVSEVYWRYGGEDGLVDILLDRHTPQQSKNVFGKYNALTLIQDRATFNRDVFAALSDSIKGEPIVVESVQVEDVQFSKDYIDAVKERMIAEVKVQQLHQQEEQQKVNAEITVINAKAAADAQVAQATAAAKSIQMQGEAQAAAIKAQAEALSANPNLVQLRYAERWNGTLPTTMIPGAVLPFMNIGQEVAKQ